MIAYLKQFVNAFNKPRIWLLLANIFLAFFLILLSNLDILPIRNLGDFIFFTIIYLAFALYRPGWSFLFFVGTIALENISLAPKEVGIMVRPYQFIGGLTLLAVLIKLAVKRLGFKLPKWNWYDLLFIFFAFAGFLSTLGAANKGMAFKQSIVAASFVALYFLARIFIQNTGDLKRIAPFFLSSSLIIVFYGLWQNFRFARGLNSFEAMPGRPNASFTEPDWLGIYLVLLLAVIYTLIYYFQKNSNNVSPVISNFQFPISKKIQNSKFKIQNFFLYIILTTLYIILILTVSRSAWLGAFAVTFFYLFIIWTNLKFNPKNWQWSFAIKNKLCIITALIISIAIVYIFHLTTFQLFSRAQSTGGLQKITVSCKENVSLPEKIQDITELEQYHCRHINLEEIDQEKAAGNFVTEISRPDPNVNIRGIIYQKSWNEIKNHPILGIGWGNIGNILGKDESGTTLNSSNIFLEVWLGSGILGLLAFALIWIFAIINSVKYFVSDNIDSKFLGLLLFLGSIALIIPNLFNAGIFIGALWLFFVLLNIESKI